MKNKLFSVCVFTLIVACSADLVDNNRSNPKHSDKAEYKITSSMEIHCPDYFDNFEETLFYLSEECLNALPPVEDMLVVLEQHGYDLNSVSDELLAVAFYQTLSQEDSKSSDDPLQSSFSLAEISVSIPDVGFDLGNLHITTHSSTGSASGSASCSDTGTINANASLSGSTLLDIVVPTRNVATIPAPVLPRTHYISAGGRVYALLAHR